MFFLFFFFFFFQAEDGIRDWSVTGVQTCALPIFALAVFGLVALPWLHKRKFPLGKHGAAAVFGLIFGIVIVLGMLDPVRIAPGVIVDGRSTLMALAGFIGGPLSAVVAAVLADGFRFWLGGVGTLVGVANVTLAGVIGVAVRWMALR